MVRKQQLFSVLGEIVPYKKFKKRGGEPFSDAPYYVRGVSISQDVCLSVCARHFQFRVENYTLIKLYHALVASYSLLASLSNKFVSSIPI